MELITDADFAAWAALADPSLPPGEAARVAATGHIGQLAELVTNPALPVDVMLTLVARSPQVAAMLVLEQGVPTEVVAAVIQTYPDDAVLIEIASQAWSAPVAAKLAVALRDISGQAVAGFYASTHATPQEQAIVDAALLAARLGMKPDSVTGPGDITLGEIWTKARLGLG